MSERPKKRWELKVELSAHSKPDLIWYLKDYLFELQRDDQQLNICGSTGIIVASENADAPIKEDYDKLLVEYIEEKRKEEKSA